VTAGLRAFETAFPAAVAVLVVATLVLLAAIAAQSMIRHSPAAKHAVVLIALLTVGLCPVMVTIAPPIGVARLTSSLPNPIKFHGSLSRSASTVLAIQNDAHVLSSSSRQLPLAAILVVFWGAGVTVCWARLIRGLRTVSRVRRSGIPLPGARMVVLRNLLASAFGRNLPEIRASEWVGVPVVLGWLRPIVLLPSSFLTRFDDRQLFQILVHECAHALRHDTLFGLYQRLLAGVLWFHPLIHIANRVLDRSREELCDNYVLQFVPPAEYSRTLLMVAQLLSPVPNGWSAPTLVQSARQLEGRVAGLLNPRRCIMNSLTSRITAIIAMAFIGGALVLSCFAAAPTDEEAVRATVTNYIEAYYTGDAARMEKCLHPHYLKHTISGSDGELRMSEWTGLEIVQAVRSHAPQLPASERKEQVTVLDISDDIASAKLVTAHWVDYMTLSKWNGEWKIVSVVLRETD
jgi:beta-lactamase regulating signal transducer with metallopeptidase domain